MKKIEDIEIIKWKTGAVILAGILFLMVRYPLIFIFDQDLPFIGFLGRGCYVIVLSCFLCLYRIYKGPTGADRIVAVDILGIMIVGLCALLTISTGRSWYIDIGIAWALQSFISTLAFSKYLEGKDFDE
ncbi:MAG: cation:proton antiporter [Candidatus Omnitrophota bacterium]